MAANKLNSEEMEAHINALNAELEKSRQQYLLEINELTEREALLIKQLESVQADLENYFIKYKQAEFEKGQGSKEDIEKLEAQIREKNQKLHSMSQKLKLTREELAIEQSKSEDFESEIKKLSSEVKRKDEEIKTTVSSLVAEKNELEDLKQTILNNRGFVAKALAKIKSGMKKGSKSNSDDNSKELALLNDSSFFDAAYYLKKNPDVAAEGVDPATHFLKFGGFEGRNPSSEFNSAWYLSNNADVRNEKLNPLVHFLMYGQKEGRKPKKG